ncbi:N-acetylmuramoyl-L-alanine amidase [Arsenophonus symbiont of Ornithomya chloropus]|uniref:N-acetylmuramoyl-L-alanine amidase n=1 Tax=Arsenophonus symbiont of Ornithomya chloropus TaxID=634121 RepID=UPI0032B1ADF1
MDCFKNDFLRQLLLKGVAISLLLIISPLVFSVSANIVAIRIWSSSSYTRVTLESTVAFEYCQFVLSFPDRIVVDLKNIRLNRVLKDINKKINSNDRHLKLIRVGVFNHNTIRLVFEVKMHLAAKIFTISPIGNFKHRLVIDFSPYSNIRFNKNFFSKTLEKHNQKKSYKNLSIKRKNIGKLMNRNKLITIMIDPGHGGEDPGAIGKYNTREKDIVLQIARRLKTLINTEPNMKVYMTRNADVFVPLKIRVAKAQKMQSDLFVSIHADAVINRKAKGSSVFALSTKAITSSNTARYLAEIQNQADLIGGVSKSGDKYLDHTIFDLIQTATINDSLKIGREILHSMASVNKLHKNIVDQAGFIVLKAPEIPSILVETAFISNIEEERKLKTAKFQQQIAESIFLGIKAYFK